MTALSNSKCRDGFHKEHKKPRPATSTEAQANSSSEMALLLKKRTLEKFVRFENAYIAQMK